MVQEPCKGQFCYRTKPYITECRKPVSAAGMQAVHLEYLEALWRRAPHLQALHWNALVGISGQGFQEARRLHPP